MIELLEDGLALFVVAQFEPELNDPEAEVKLQKLARIEIVFLRLQFALVLRHQPLSRLDMLEFRRLFLLLVVKILHNLLLLVRFFIVCKFGEFEEQTTELIDQVSAPAAVKLGDNHDLFEKWLEAFGRESVEYL